MTKVSRPTNSLVGANYGFSAFQHQELMRIVAEFPSVCEVKIFGSRAKGNYKLGSDVDLAVFGDNVSYDVIAALAYELNEESILPYYFDVLAVASISSAALIKHINDVGFVIYRKQSVD